jgi:beta-N-acetylhexosaminidase
MYLRFRIIAAELQALGLDVNCAPVADIAQPETHPFLRNRCYGDTLDRVVPLARAAANGLLAGGVLPVLKHMPGHGRAQVDSHLDLPNVAASAATLQAQDFAAFAGLKDVPMAMTAHVVYDAFDLQPATISAPMLKIMRQEIGFSGLIMTDDISMQALPADVATRAALAIVAGCDVVLHCNGQIDEMRAVVAASGPLTAAARRRAELALAQRHPGDMVDISALEAQILRLTTGRAHD